MERVLRWDSVGLSGTQWDRTHSPVGPGGSPRGRTHSPVGAVGGATHSENSHLERVLAFQWDRWDRWEIHSKFHSGLGGTSGTCGDGSHRSHWLPLAASHRSHWLPLAVWGFGVGAVGSCRWELALADETARSSDPRHQRLAQRHRQTTLLHYDFKNCVSKILEMRPIWIRTCFSAFATRPPSPPSSPSTTPPFKGAARP